MDGSTDATLDTPTGPVLSADGQRRLRVQRFLDRITAAKQTAERPGFRLRITPQVYDPAKNVYVVWPERAWTMEVIDLAQAEGLFEALDKALTDYSQR